MSVSVVVWLFAGIVLIWVTLGSTGQVFRTVLYLRYFGRYLFDILLQMWIFCASVLKHSSTMFTECITYFSFQYSHEVEEFK